MKIENFGNWNPSIHFEFEQLKRIIAAQEIKKSAIKFSNNQSQCHILGSKGTYLVTLEKCECSDFSLRGLPCKHIYCFAINKGLITELPEYTPEKARLFDINVELQRYTNLFLQGSIKAETFKKLMTALSAVDPDKKEKSNSVLNSSSKPDLPNVEPNPTAKTFVIAGMFGNTDRLEVMQTIYQHGHRVSDSVSRKTDYLVVGDEPGSKLNKAKELGIKTINLEELYKILN